jgi:type III pantothenate kinase
VILAVDIGNTNLKIGLWDGDLLSTHWRLTTDYLRSIDEYGLQLHGLLTHYGLNLTALKGAAISSVVPPLTNTLQNAIQKYLEIEPLVIHHKLALGIAIKYEDPAAVGTDRLCDAVAVQQKYGGPACIIDFGTATTFNALTAKGEYLGGAITADLWISADALFQKAFKLPRVDLKSPPSVIGRNTIHAMQSGLLYGYTALVDGMVSRFRLEMGEHMKVIGTGGMVEIIAKETNSISIVEPHLTLDGIRRILELNRK